VVSVWLSECSLAFSPSTLEYREINLTLSNYLQCKLDDPVHFPQHGFEVVIARRDAPSFLLIGAFMIAGSQAGPGANVLGRREGGHLFANFCQNGIGSRQVNPRD